MIGNNVSHSKRRTKRVFDVNLFTKKFYYVEQDCWISLNICAAGLRVINKKGLDAALNALGVDGIDVDKHRRRCLPEGPLSPLKRPKSSNASVRGSKSDYLTGVSAGRSKSDIKRPIRGGRGCLSPLGGR